jgi:hypothetical protein
MFGVNVNARWIIIGRPSGNLESLLHEAVSPKSQP